MIKKRTIVLVLKTSKDFAFRDVELIARHINGKWKSQNKPRIICLWDRATEHYNLGNIELIPLTNNWEGTWSRMQLYSPEMEQYRPFLYVDLDTAIIESLENIFELVPDPSMFIPLEDFYQKGQLATGIAWIPANSKKITEIWKAWKGVYRKRDRMDYFLRKATTPDVYWQNLTTTIQDFKPKGGELLKQIPSKTNIVCFHGKPRIHQVAESSISIDWVKDYVNTIFVKQVDNPEVTVIIPYNKDRGYLQEAINSVPEGVQLLLSRGDGNWPQNFNKALPSAKGKYIRWLHEDDILTEDSITKSITAIKKQKVDFIHGDAVEFKEGTEQAVTRAPRKPTTSLKDLLVRNYIHQCTLMYKREVFDKLGGLDESDDVYSFEEFEFNLRCLQAGFKLGYCPSILGFYRRHPEQIIRNVKKSERLARRNKLLKRYQ